MESGLQLPFDSLQTLAVWLGTTGAAGWIGYWLLARWAWFQEKVSGPIKKGVTLALFIGLPFVSEGVVSLLAMLTPEAAASLNHIFALVLSGLGAWSVSQAAKAKQAAVEAGLNVKVVK